MANDNSGAIPEDLPSPHELAKEQTQLARERLAQDPSTFPRFDIPSLHALTGSHAPGELILFGAQVGAGKSLFAHNLIEMYRRQRKPCVILGTEQAPEILRIKHACVMAQVPFKLILKPEPEEINTVKYYEAMDKVDEALTLLQIDEDFVCWANAPYVDRTVLQAWINYGVYEMGAQAFIVDHLHQMEHGPGTNAVQELTATVQLAQRNVVEHKMVGWLFCQLKRRIGITGLAAHGPPGLEDFAGTSALERNGTLVLGGWRPLRADTSRDELKALIADRSLGLGKGESIYQANTMGIVLLKDRLGDVFGKQAMLDVDRNRLSQQDERHATGTSYDDMRKM